MERPLKVFTGMSNPALALEICEHLGVPLGRSETQRLSNDNFIVRFQESLREADVFLVQSLSSNPDTGMNVSDALLELLLMVDAAKGASAHRVTVVIPYFSYARSDKKDEPRISIAARLVADVIQTAGADRILTMTLHSPQVHGFFKIPMDHLTSEVVIANHFAMKFQDMSDVVVVATDAGDIKRASSMARRLEASLAFIDKRRVSDTKVESRGLIGEVKNRIALIIDDEISTAGTLVEAVHMVREEGAREVYVACSHGVYVGPAVERIRNLDITECVSTNSVYVPPFKLEGAPKLTVLSIAGLFAQAIEHIHTGESVSSLFT
jgi:ribose-phosphate pyrophosphokinase